MKQIVPYLISDLMNGSKKDKIFSYFTEHYIFNRNQSSRSSFTFSILYGKDSCLTLDYSRMKP